MGDCKTKIELERRAGALMRGQATGGVGHGPQFRARFGAPCPRTCWETWDADGPRQNPLELPGNELVLVPMSECIRFYMMHGYAEVSHVCVHSRARVCVLLSECARDCG